MSTHDDGHHQCPEADDFYRDGLVAIFYDASYPAWFMAHSPFEAWLAWQDATQPFPLTSRDQAAYEDLCVSVRFCPWCGSPLETPPQHQA